MPNYASKLGEAVGNAVEGEIQRIVKETVAPFGLYVDTGGVRPGKRKGQKLLMVNDTGTEYQIDLAVENQQGNPFLLLESKYIRYKKHNRDKASWTCVAHYKLRTTHPSVRKSIAVLMGQWSEPSKKLMNSFGVELVEIPFAHMVKTLDGYGVKFDWAEDDNTTPKRGWSAWSKLSDDKQKEIARKIIAPRATQIQRLLLEAIRTEETTVKNVERIELLLKTSQDEYFVKKFSNVRDTIAYLLQLTKDIDDVKGLLK